MSFQGGYASGVLYFRSVADDRIVWSQDLDYIWPRFQLVSTATKGDKICRTTDQFQKQLRRELKEGKGTANLAPPAKKTTRCPWTNTSITWDTVILKTLSTRLRTLFGNGWTDETSLTLHAATLTAKNISQRDTSQHPTAITWVYTHETHTMTKCTSCESLKNLHCRKILIGAGFAWGRPPTQFTGGDTRAVTAWIWIIEY